MSLSNGGGGLANADVIRGSLNADSCWQGEGVKFAKILLTSYVNAPLHSLCITFDIKLTLPLYCHFLKDRHKWDFEVYEILVSKNSSLRPLQEGKKIILISHFSSFLYKVISRIIVYFGHVEFERRAYLPIMPFLSKSDVYGFEKRA